ncbi:MAG: apolipoprotein N-acyltransferase [Burkholderiaceae bacterium]
MKKLLFALMLLATPQLEAQTSLWLESNVIDKNINGGTIVKNDTVVVEVKLNDNFTSVRSVFFDFQHQKDAIQLLSIERGPAIPQSATVNIDNFFYPNCKFNRNAQNTTNDGWANWMNANYTCNSSTVPYHAINRIMVNVSSTENLSQATYIKLKFRITNVSAGFPYDSVYMNFAVAYDAVGAEMRPTVNVPPKATWIQLAPNANNLITGEVKHSENVAEAIKSSMVVMVTDTATPPVTSLPIAERFQRQSVALTDVDLIVWPEVALPFYQDELPLDYLPILKAHSADFVIGLLDRDEARAGVPYYNVALGIGAEQTTYRKHQLVPFGEYLPLAFLLRWLLDYLRIPMSDFSAGALQQAAMPLAGTKVGASICYEDAFSDVIRRSASASHVLVNLSEDAWFGDSLAPHQRLQMARARVLETGRPMIRASNSGLSSIIRHDGTVTGQAGQFVEAVLRGRVQPTQGTTFFARAGNGPVIGLCLFGFLIGAPRAWIRRRGR